MEMRRCGGWEPVKDPSNEPDVKEMAEFVVSEYNAFAKISLKFEKVISAKTQLVAGQNYRMIMSASGGSYIKYEAVVCWVPWEDYRKLESFKPI